MIMLTHQWTARVALLVLLSSDFSCRRIMVGSILASRTKREHPCVPLAQVQQLQPGDHFEAARVVPVPDVLENDLNICCRLECIWDRIRHIEDGQVWPPRHEISVQPSSPAPFGNMKVGGR